MTHKTFHLEIITPCFCAGADPAKAEIRAPSIRGQLRWWFRTLGGSHQDEATIFGNAAGDEGTASRLLLRVSDYKAGKAWNPPAYNQNDNSSYVWHYAKASSDSRRWQPQGALSPGSTFTVHIIFRLPLSPNLQIRFDQALQAFLALGSLGLRQTRGLGSFHCPEAANYTEVMEDVSKLGFTCRQRSQPGVWNTIDGALSDYAAWLRHDFRQQHKADRPSPLGGITPKRQGSAVRFRPIKLPSGQFTWVAYEAPHARVLGRVSQTPNPLLATKALQGNAPSRAPK
jgi:CRISPR type III-B/RAMP module RAMP protein Cmr1